ncbi:translation initiation factor IF-2-like [Nycticebus coucang]|uniref:translation initiation factor IF-2-like n=1 Tax=Nycticebus coucang TaxID=9470 RepID=UPI00234E0E85|nr:translation initiation factor IF-2-like [Nycticebus coucang]
MESGLPPRLGCFGAVAARRGTSQQKGSEFQSDLSNRSGKPKTTYTPTDYPTATRTDSRRSRAGAGWRPVRLQDPPRGLSRLLPHSQFPASRSRVATRVLATDHTFLAEKGEERGEQQGPHVGDPPLRRRLLLAGAHHPPAGLGVQGRLLRRVGESSSPLSVTEAGGPGSQARHPAAPPARGGRRQGRTKLTAGRLRAAPSSRPARFVPDGRCPRAPATALNSQLLLEPSRSGGGGGREIQHGSGGGRDHWTEAAGERAETGAGPGGPGAPRRPGPRPSGRGAPGGRGGGAVRGAGLGLRLSAGSEGCPDPASAA